MNLDLPEVLIVDDEFRADLYELWLDDVFSLRKARSREQAIATIDESVGVVLLRHEIRDDVKAAIESRVRSVSPLCRIAITTSKRTEILSPTIDAEACIAEPITKEKIRETTMRLMKRALYHGAIREYFRMAFQVTNIQIQDGEEVHEKDEQQLHDDFSELSELVSEIGSLLDAKDRNAVLGSLRPEVAFPTEEEEAAADTNKYRPDKCSDCGLTWGVHHGGVLDEGFNYLGAFTWKCRSCGAVQSLPSPTDRRVARR